MVVLARAICSYLPDLSPRASNRRPVLPVCNAESPRRHERGDLGHSARPGSSLLLHAWTPLTVFAWNTPGWSVSAEAFFYALFPSLIERLKAHPPGGFSVVRSSSTVRRSSRRY